MEWVLLGIVAFISLIGGFIAFFGLFNRSKHDYSQQIESIQAQLAELRTKLDRLQTAQKQSTQASQTSVPMATISLPTDIVPEITLPNVVSPKIDLPITGAELTAQPLNNSSEQAITSPVTAVQNTPAPIPYAPVAYTPNALERGISYAKNWLFGGNTLVRSGIVILFIGISFLLKYAADHTNIPIEFRLTGIALAGVSLLAFGFKLRNSRPQYSWALQGGGIGIMYLTIFAALKLYHLIPANMAFALLIIVAMLSAAIAVLQSALPLAMLGFAGGFIAPVLTSSGHGSHVSLFSYFLVLNIGIAATAFYKSWRPLNVLGFVFTFVIGSLWGARSYLPEHFASTEPFLIIHFLLFTLIAVLYAFRQAPKVSDYVDSTLVFGTPIVGFSLQYALLRNSHFGMAYSALALGIFYIALAWWLLTRKRDTVLFLGECFLALGIGFATLAIPLALDGRWTSAAWAVEGVALLWAGLRQNRTLPKLAGLALQLLGAFAFVKGWGLTSYNEAGSAITHQNMFLGVGFIALSGWACGALLNKLQPAKNQALTTILAGWGWLWWVSTGLTAIDELLPNNVFAHAALAFVALTSLALPFIARRLQWQKLVDLSALLLPALFVAMLVDCFFKPYNHHPFAEYGVLIWPFSFGAYAWLLFKNYIQESKWLRAPVLWIAAIVGIVEWQFQVGQYVYESPVWREIGWAIVPTLIAAAVIYWQFGKKTSLSLSELNLAEQNLVQLTSAKTWAWLGLAPIMAFLAAWFMIMSLNSDGNAAPLPYVPLINPLDISLCLVLMLAFIWQRHVCTLFNKLQNIAPIAASVMGFTLLNGILLRTLHHWMGTPFEWVSIFNNSTVQLAFTFLWGITAFILMLLAHKRLQRPLWMVGAALMGLVVAKLFLLDLAQHGSVQRIVSFIAAGIMLLVMGYFAPLPPAKKNIEGAVL